MVDLLFFLTAIIGRLSVASRGTSASSELTLNTTYENVTYLINNMLKTYDIRLRPNFGEKPLVLDLDIAIASFDSVSEVNMDFTLTMYLYQTWRDERLAWLPNLRNQSITLSGDFSQKIWVPDTFLANDKSSYLHDVTETNKMLKLYSDGYIAYGMRFTSTLACKMDLRSFPLDRQNFSVEIESYGYTTSDVFMRWKNGRKSVRGVMDSEIPQFRIIDYQAEDRVETTATGSYQRLSLVLMLRRSVGYYIFQTYLPSSLIVALSWISFWINHEATAARVALGVTTVLTMTTISTGVRSSLPRISYIKAIDVYLVMCFVFVFAALLEYAAVNYTYWGSSRTGKRGRRRRSDVNTEHQYGGRRRLTNPAATEFPTWEMYVQKEEDEPESSPSAGRRRRSQAYTMRVEKEGGGEDSEREEEVLIASASGTSGRLSPIPGLLQQQHHRQLSSGAPDASPAVVLHSASSPSTLRRRPASSLAPTQQLLDYNDGEQWQKGGRRAQSLQVHTRRSVSFNAWRGKGGSAGRQLSRRELMMSLRQKARAVRAVLPRIHDVNMIDKWSRAMFPFSFVLFNFVYWCYYVFSDWND